MRKNLLALSIAAMVGGLSGAANAQVALFNNSTTTNDAWSTATPSLVGASPLAPATGLAPTTTGVGHILVVPYFTTQGANHTLLNITNTDLVNGKAVKLRYRGAANSDDVFDITVYLSPGDVWAADVAEENGFSRLVTNDNSCTLPSKADIKAANNGRFKTNRVQAGDKAQTREGYIEILNTANIPPGTGPLGANSALYTATKHVGGVAPCTQAVMDLQENDLNAAGALDPNDFNNRGYANPTGGLFANWVLVNVAGFASHSGEAVAIRATGGNAQGNIVWFPQTTDAPTAAPVVQLTADPLLTSAGFAGSVANYDFPDLSTPYFGALSNDAPSAQANALSAAVAASSVSNEYLTDAGFSTDWVFSMPTRRYHVALDYAAPAASRLLFRANVAAGDIAAPAANAGTNYFNRTNTGLNAAGTQACVTPGSGTRGYSREEDTQSTFVISPDTAVKLCGETSVLAFNAVGADSVLAAAIARNDIKTNFKEGWMRINTNNGVRNGAVGLPVVGYAAAKVSGQNLGGTWEHRYGR
jgi:hypothetical protein